jgi:hypothetical protein
MQGAKNGDRVRINYIVKTGSGERIEANLAGIPMEFTIGKDETIEGFEKGLLDMKTGEIKSIHLSPDQAYGQREERKVFEMPKERLPKDLTPVSARSSKCTGRTDLNSPQPLQNIRKKVLRWTRIILFQEKTSFLTWSSWQYYGKPLNCKMQN